MRFHAGALPGQPDRWTRCPAPRITVRAQTGGLWGTSAPGPAARDGNRSPASCQPTMAPGISQGAAAPERRRDGTFRPKPPGGRPGRGLCRTLRRARKRSGLIRDPVKIYTRRKFRRKSRYRDIGRPPEPGGCNRRWLLRNAHDIVSFGSRKGSKVLVGEVGQAVGQSWIDLKLFSDFNMLPYEFISLPGTTRTSGSPPQSRSCFGGCSRQAGASAGTGCAPRRPWPRRGTTPSAFRMAGGGFSWR